MRKLGVEKGQLEVKLSGYEDLADRLRAFLRVEERVEISENPKAKKRREKELVTAGSSLLATYRREKSGYSPFDTEEDG